MAPTLPDRCAPRSDALTLYVSTEGGYCLLFPTAFRMTSDGAGQVAFHGTQFDPYPEDTDPVPSLSASLSLDVKEMGSEMTVAQWVDSELREQLPPEMQVERTSIMLGDISAELLNGMPAMYTSSRHLFMIHEGRGYHLTFYPMDTAFPLVEEEMASLWQAVQASFTFLPADFRTAYAACPTSTEAAFAYLNVLNGYCLLVERGASVLTRPSGPITVQQTYGQGPEEGVGLVINPLFKQDYATAEEYAAATLAAYPPEVTAGVSQSTLLLGGETAVVVDGLPGQSAYRHLFVVHENWKLELLALPYNDPNLPIVQPLIQAIFDQAVASFTWVPVAQP